MNTLTFVWNESPPARATLRFKLRRHAQEVMTATLETKTVEHYMFESNIMSADHLGNWSAWCADNRFRRLRDADRCIFIASR